MIDRTKFDQIVHSSKQNSGISTPKLFQAKARTEDSSLVHSVTKEMITRYGLVTSQQDFIKEETEVRESYNDKLHLSPSTHQDKPKRILVKNNQEWIQVAPTVIDMKLPIAQSVSPMLSENTSNIQSRNPPTVSIAYRQGLAKPKDSLNQRTTCSPPRERSPKQKPTVMNFNHIKRGSTVKTTRKGDLSS